MSEFVANIQDKMKSSTAQIIARVLKLLTGLWLGATIATVMKTITGSGTLGYVFIVIMTTGVIHRLLREWSIFAIVVFNLVFLLTAVLLRMYIHLAPEVVI